MVCHSNSSSSSSYTITLIFLSGQRVGYGPYMIKPRYVRPPEPESRNELHDLMLQVGAIKTNEISKN